MGRRRLLVVERGEHLEDLDMWVYEWPSKLLSRKRSVEIRLGRCRWLGVM